MGLVCNMRDSGKKQTRPPQKSVMPKSVNRAPQFNNNILSGIDNRIPGALYIIRLDMGCHVMFVPRRMQEPQFNIEELEFHTRYWYHMSSIYKLQMIAKCCAIRCLNHILNTNRNKRDCNTAWLLPA
jgi:hypothetical protein